MLSRGWDSAARLEMTGAGKDAGRVSAESVLRHLHRVPVEVVSDSLPEVLGKIRMTMLNNF